ncbi:MAG: prolyl oligopeptidase family serine peptidase [Acidobacteria bacterium]|nr:prolyl oligopeptidase family serine peptidase [Acidobacteriota bacterium]
MPVRHCIWAIWLLLAVAASGAGPRAQTAAQPAGRTSRGYTVFVAGAVAGREDVTVESTADGVVISGQGRLSGSRDVVVRRAEVRYGRDWAPAAYELEASVGGGDITLYTSFPDGTAVTKGVDEGGRIDQTDTLPPRAVVLPNVFFGAYEALTRQLVTTAAEAAREFPVFVGAKAQGALRVVGASVEQMQVGTSTFNVRRYQLSFAGPRGLAIVNVYADDSGSLLRVNVPVQRVDVMRDDLASATSRTVVFSNPSDEAVTLPAAGFNLGATLTWPASRAAAAKLPAVVLLADAAASERDGVVGGVPILGRLAGAIADAGFVAVRFDKRGYGQSGGRAESASLGDQADDALAVVRWLGERRDIDRDRIAVVGHNEGAWAALLAATRERRIAAVVSIAAPSVTGSERVLEQQRHVLERMDVPPAERVAKIELQSRINAAVVSGRGWDALPPDVRKQADTPWFQSLLAFDPARVMRDVRQPLLLVHGELDAEVPVSHLDRLGEIAQKQGRSKMVNVVAVRGVNHLLTPAVTGEIGEYASLTNRNLSADVTTAINTWLTRTFAAVR